MKLSEIMLALDSDSISTNSEVKIVTLNAQSPITGKMKELIKLEGDADEWESFTKRISRCLKRNGC